jgi:hypothetical protein
MKSAAFLLLATVTRAPHFLDYNDSHPDTLHEENPLEAFDSTVSGQDPSEIVRRLPERDRGDWVDTLFATVKAENAHLMQQNSYLKGQVEMLQNLIASKLGEISRISKEKSILQEQLSEESKKSLSLGLYLGQVLEDNRRLKEHLRPKDVITTRRRIFH